jgi:hypothetical protein
MKENQAMELHQSARLGRCTRLFIRRALIGRTGLLHSIKALWRI